MYNITEENLKNSYYYASVMSVILCIFMMFFYDVIVEYGEADFTSTRLIRLTRLVLSLIQLSMAIVYAYYWYILNNWEKPCYQSKEKDAGGEGIEVPKPPPPVEGSEAKKLFMHFIHCVKESVVGGK